MADFTIPNPLPSTGFAFPVNDIHGTLLLFNLFTVGTSRNSINPRLVLHSTKLEVKVLKTDYYDYSAITKADYQSKLLWGSPKVVVELPKHNVAFVIFVSSDAAVKSLLQFLQSQGVALSEKAQRVVNS